MKVVERCRVKVVSNGLPAETLRRCYVEPAASVDVGELALGSVSAQAAIEALVRDLPHDQAEVVLLRVVADLSVDEVAKVMGRSPGSVRVLQHRALRQLGRIWDRGAVTR